MNTESTEIPVPNARPRLHRLRLAVVCLVLLIIAGSVAWRYQLLPGMQPSTRENAVMQTAAARGQLSDSDEATFLRKLHSSILLAECVTRIEDGKVPQESLRAILLVIRNMNEVEIHRMRGASDNKVYVSPNGKQEAVYDREGKSVEDGINDGSYNYFGQAEEPLKHFTFDIAPWLLLGGSRKDPTTCKERASAYAADVFAGVASASQDRSVDSDIVLPQLDERGNVEAFAIFVLAMELGKAEQIIDIVNSRRKVPDRELIDIVQKFELGLQQLLCAGDNHITKPASRMGTHNF